MDILKPELQTIDGICYRINPGNYVSTIDRGQPQPYVELDEVACPLEDSSEDEGEVTMEPNGRAKVSFHVANSFFPYIIGARGATKKRLETETKTRITIPRLGQEGDIIITGPNKNGVLSAKRRILNLARSAKSKMPATHFISIPLNDPAFQKGFLEFKEGVMKACPEISEALFQTESKLHLTIAVMVLCDNTDRKEASNAFIECYEKIVKPLLGGRPLHLKMEGLEYFGDDPSQIDVLYAKVVSVGNQNLLQELCNQIYFFMAEKGILDQKQDKVTVHATVMNSKFELSTENPDQRREKFDITKILEGFRHFSFGEAHVKRLDLSVRFTFGDDGYYQSSSSVELP